MTDSGRDKRDDNELSYIRKRIEEIDKERWGLIKRLQEIEDGRAQRKFTCECVRKNGDIDITNMQEQEAAGRKGLQMGLVYETLSSLKACPSCHGSGIPSGGPVQEEQERS
jgi:hypothetical protein